MMTWLDGMGSLADEYAAAVNAGAYSDEAIRAPDASIGYGSDLAGWQDMTAEAAEHKPDDPNGPVDYLLRMITTDEGKLPDDTGGDPGVAQWGINVMAWCNAPWKPEDFAIRARAVEDMIKTCDYFPVVKATFTRSGDNAATLEIRGTIAMPDAAKPFALTLLVTSSDVLIKALSL
jgi:hypothetical protein